MAEAFCLAITVGHCRATTRSSDRSIQQSITRAFINPIPQWFTKAGFVDVKITRIGPKWYRGVRRHGLIMGCSVTGVKPKVRAVYEKIDCLFIALVDATCVTSATSVRQLLKCRIYWVVLVQGQLCVLWWAGTTADRELWWGAIAGPRFPICVPIQLKIAMHVLFMGV